MEPQFQNSCKLIGCLMFNEAEMWNESLQNKSNNKPNPWSGGEQWCHSEECEPDERLCWGTAATGPNRRLSRASDSLLKTSKAMHLKPKAGLLLDHSLSSFGLLWKCQAWHHSRSPRLALFPLPECSAAHTLHFTLSLCVATLTHPRWPQSTLYLHA